MLKVNSIDKLSSLVLIRNHLMLVINDKTVCQKGDYQILHKIRMDLDRLFIKSVKEFDFSEKVEVANETDLTENSFEPEVELHSGNNSSVVISPVDQDSSELKAVVSNIFEETSNSYKESVKLAEKKKLDKIKKDTDLSTPEDHELIKSRLAEEKLKLSKKVSKKASKK